MLRIGPTRFLVTASVWLVLCVALAGCGGTKASPPAPTELSSVYLAYTNAIQAGDGALACGLATTKGQMALVNQEIPGGGPEYCPQVATSYAGSPMRFGPPVVESGSIQGDDGMLIVTQPFKEGTLLKRRINLQRINGRWLFDGINNLALTEQ